MRALFSTVGGSGHFGPMLPHARALRAAGHTVAFSAPGSFAPQVEAAGFELLPRPEIPPDKFGAVLAGIEKLSVEEGNTRYVREVFGRLNLEAGLAAARGIVREWRPDLVVRETAEITGLVVSEESRIPLVQVGIGLLVNEEFVEPLMGEALDEAGFSAARGRMGHAERLSAVPPSLDEHSARPGPTHRFREDPGSSADLPDWWPGNSDPLVYMTLGTEAGRMALFPAFYRALIDSVADAPVRVLFTLGAADPAALGDLPPNVHVEGWWPQASAMAGAAAVAAHGGYGTMLGALAAGLPSVNLPLFAIDQHDNARRLEAMGAGVTLAGPDAPAGLAPALLRVLGDTGMRARAEALAAEMAALPRAAESVPLLERVANRR